MRLKNKKTGEIGYLLAGKTSHSYFVTNDEWDRCGIYNSLAELSEEWEDAPEEPKEYWYIGDGGEVYGFSDYYLGTEIEETHKEMGNLFESKEEAKKAVRKLKAWKRLKDKGFRVIDYGDEDIRYEIKDRYDGCLYDLETVLFGGEK